MEIFLDFITENYIYFLIAAGVLTLALIGLIVSNKKKGKEELPVQEIQETEVNIDTQPVISNNIQSNEPAGLEIVNEEELSTPEPTIIINEPVVSEVTNSGGEILNLESTPLEPVNNYSEPVQESPAINLNEQSNTPVNNYDEPIISVEQTENNNFQIDQNNNNNM